MSWVLRVTLGVLVLSWAAESCPGGWPPPSATSSAAPRCVDGECANGECEQPSGTGAGLFGGRWRAPRADGPIAQEWDTPRSGAESLVVPVWLGPKSSPVVTGGVYMGEICGRGVTLTCWHVAKHEIHRVGGETAIEIIRDGEGYDLAAILTEPLSFPAAQIGATPSPGDPVTILGFPKGRFSSHSGQVVGHHHPGGNQRWGDLALSCSSQPGDSGGPVLCRGRLVGLLWGTQTGRRQGSVAVPISAIVNFLRRLRARCECPDEDPEVEIIWRTDDQPGVTPPPIGPDQPQVTPPACDLTAIQAELAELRVLILGIERGPQGEPGPPGDDGVSPTMDYQAIADQLIPLLPPLTFQARYPDGRLYGSPVQKRLGDTVFLKTPKAQTPGVQ